MWDTDRDRRVGRQARDRREIWQKTAQYRVGALRWRDLSGDAEPVNQIRKLRAPWVPQIGVAAQRADVAGHLPGQPPAPVLGIGQNMGEAIAQSCLCFKQPMQLRAKVETVWQAGRTCLGKGGPEGIVVLGQIVRAAVFVIKHRRGKPTFCIQQHRRGTVGGDRDRIHAMLGMKRSQIADQEIPMPFKVEMRIGRPRQHGVRPRDDCDFLQRAILDQCQFGIGLADIDDGDVLHGRWNIGTSGTATGSLSGCVAMISAICAHHFCMTGWVGRSAMP